LNTFFCFALRLQSWRFFILRSDMRARPGYIAVMTLFGVAAAAIKPASLV